MATEKLEENTINRSTLKVACWLADARRVVRNFQVAAVGFDTYRSRLFIQTHIFLPDPIDPDKHSPTIFTEELITRSLISESGAKKAIALYTRARDVPEDPFKFLSAPYARVNPDLTVAIDETKTGLWRMYEKAAFGDIYIIADQPTLVVWGRE